jgi:hypothetical protein
MSAQLATVGDRILAHVEDAGAIPDGSLIPSITGDRPQIGGMQFDCDISRRTLLLIPNAWK